MSLPHTSRPAAGQQFPWYDSLWLSEYARAQRIVRELVPERESEFESAFDVLRTRADFHVIELPGFLDEDMLARVRSIASSLTPQQLEMHEARTFRRFVVHDHPFFTQLQSELIDQVSAAVGEDVEASYNFLSLYGPQGVCPVHMDAPLAKWTLDICISQSVAWPIHFSRVVPWPRPGQYSVDWEREIKAEAQRDVTTHILEPGQALLFAGSSQWHWREPMPTDRPGPHHCDLLFLHYIPRGTRDLLEPRNWARLFGIPELAQTGSG